jgi:hypothetical protein
MDEDDLDPPKPLLSGVKCARCFEPLPVGVERCPRCRQATGDLPRSLPVILAVAGILGVLLLVLLIYRTTATAQIEPRAVEQPASDRFAPAPETSAGHETPPPAPSGSEKPPEPPAPEKKAPLDR